MKIPLFHLCVILAFPRVLQAFPSTKQEILQVEMSVMPVLENAPKVPGHNNATYGPVPRTEQLFEIEFYEIAPSTVPV